MGFVKGKRFDLVEKDLKENIDVAHNKFGVSVKYIVEDAYTTPTEKKQLYELVARSGADFIKTSTGFADLKDAQFFGNQTIGAAVQNVKLMAEIAKETGSKIGIKVAGGIGSLADAKAMWEAADRDLNPRDFRIGASRTLNIYNEVMSLRK